MLPTDYLLHGLTALARSATVETQMPISQKRVLGAGHAGAGLISSYYLTRENDLPPEIEALVAARAERIIAANPHLVEPFAPERGRPDLVPGLVEAVGRAIEAQATHGTIFGALALKAFRNFPELATRTLVRGIESCLDLHRPYPTHPKAPPEFKVRDEQVTETDVPPYETERELIGVSLSELAVLYRWVHLPQPDGRLVSYAGAGAKGHSLTLAHALIVLDELGHTGLATAGLEMHRRLVKYARRLPPDAEQHLVTEAPFASLLDAEYWSRPTTNAHSIKAPYAVLALFKKLTPGERAAHEANVCRLMTQFVVPAQVVARAA